MDDLKDLDLDLIFDDYIPDDGDDLDPQPNNNTFLNQNSNSNSNSNCNGNGNGNVNSKKNNNTNNSNTHNKETEFVYGSFDDILLDDDDDFSDFDADELVKATENIENERTPTTAISGILTDQTPQDELQDPTPPPPLPINTPNFHSFNNQALCTWVYPVNYPTRIYQLNMVKKALFQNTLIALPTGLGKTFIAAVVMYNYWRWFPQSKVVFLAPTRPLVTQQIEACFKICGLPQAETIEMTGFMSVAKRAENWKTKRVFFMTPQTMQNDLTSRICPAERISCLVVDEAHKATGNYAYTEVIRLLSKNHFNYRVLALTATPGSNLDNVQVVVKNLHINNIQIRTEESMDIQEYTHGKQIQRMVVRLSYTQGATGVLPRAINTFQTKVFRPLLVELSKFNAVPSDDPQKNTPYGLMMSRQRFRENARNMTNFVRNKVTTTFMSCESMSRANELLCNHGIGPFVDTIDGIIKATEDTRAEGKGISPSDRKIVANNDLRQLIRHLKSEMETPGFLGHPKMEKLVLLLLEHFANSDENSKVMIFSSFRNSVDDICRALLVHHPMIRCSEFIGQGSGKSGAKGLKQAEQQKIVQRFKNNEVNVLVCTSIGEEGLDIGEVDLIVCYDSQSSPIRMLQRMGRTGRKRKGRCVLLLTEAEEKKFNTAKEAYRRVQQLIARGNLIKYHMPIPTVLPADYRPTMARERLAIGAYVSTEKKKRANKSDELPYTPDGRMKDQTRQNFIKSFESDSVVNKKTVEELMDHYWPIQSFKKEKINTTLPIQRTLQTHHLIGHSRTTKLFVNMIRRMEHRILHPGQDLPSFSKATMTTETKKQNKLIIPKRAKQTNDELQLPAKKKKKTAATLDDHFLAYMDQIGEEAGPSMLPFLENKGPSKPIPSSVDELLKGVGIEEEEDDDFDYSDVKGKRRAVEHAVRPEHENNKKNKIKESAEIDMDMDFDFDLDPGLELGLDKQIQKSTVQSDKHILKNEEVQIHSWSSMLPESPTNEQENDVLPINTETLKKGTNKESIVEKDEKRVVENKVSTITASTANNDDIFHFDSFGDDFDDAMFEQMDDMVAFNDDLPIVYPFDKTDRVDYNSSKTVEIGLIWQKSNPPTFSKRNMELLKQKYQSLKKKKGGGTLLVNMMSKILDLSFDHDSMIQQGSQRNSQPFQKQQNKNSNDNFSFDDGYDDPDFDTILKEVDMDHITKNTTSKQKQPIAIDDSQPSQSHTVHPTKELHQGEEEEGLNVKNKENHEDDMQGDIGEVIFDWGMGDEVFVTMIENKGMDMEGDGDNDDTGGFLESQHYKETAYPNKTQHKQEESTDKISTLKQREQKEDVLEEEEIILASSLSINIPVIVEEEEEEEREMTSTTEPIEKTEPITKSMSPLLSSFNDCNINEIEKTVLLAEPSMSEDNNNDDIDKTVLIPRSLSSPLFSATVNMSPRHKEKEDVTPFKSNRRTDLYITEGPVPDNVSSQPELTKADDEELVFDFMSSQKSIHVNIEKPKTKIHSSSPVMMTATTKNKKGPILMDDDSTMVILSSLEHQEEYMESQQITMTPQKKKKGRIALDSEEESTEDASQPSNRKPESISLLPLDSQEEDDDFDHYTDRILPIPKYNREEKNDKKKKKKKKKYIGGDANPFFEIEAQRSEDDIPTDDDDDINEEDEEMDTSFINDGISYMTQQQHELDDDEEEEVIINHNQLISPQGPRWMDRFHSEKWLQPQVDDTIIDDDDYDDEEVEEDDVESFSSQHKDDNRVINEDDDFM